MGDKKKAKAYLEEAYAIFYKFFGEDHPNTKVVARGLALLAKEDG
jgi:hypothetical protein